MPNLDFQRNKKWVSGKGDARCDDRPTSMSLGPAQEPNYPVRVSDVS
jgi:hypothetical protein